MIKLKSVQNGAEVEVYVQTPAGAVSEGSAMPSPEEE